MKSKLTSRLLAAACGCLAAVLLIAGCGTTPPEPMAAGAADTTTIPSTNAAPITDLTPTAGTPESTEVLKVGDSVSVVYNDLPNLQPPFDGQIKADGTITLILNQSFKAAGKTRSQLEKEIRERYVPGYFKNMTVNVSVQAATRFYFVGGEVRSPGQRPYIGRLTVVQAIQSAGDFTEFANRKNVMLTRAGSSKPIIINVKKAMDDPSKDLEVFPGDTIRVRRKIW